MRMKSEDAEAELVRRYEEMQRNGERRYFDTEDIEDIAYHYEMAHRYAEALDVVEYGLRLHPDNPELEEQRADYLLCLDRVEEAEQLINSLPSRSVDALLIRAEIAMIRENLPTAADLITEVLASDELSWEVCLDVIELFFDYNYTDRIAPFTEEALSRLPEDEQEDFLHELAHLYEERSLPEEAITTYNRLLDKCPYTLDYWIDLARLLEEQGKYDEAIEACDFALTIDENDLEVLFFRGCCFYDKGDLKTASQIFDSVSEHATDKGTALAMLSACYSRLGLYSKAIETMQSAIRDYHYTLNADLYCQMASDYYEIDDMPHAREALAKALAADDCHLESLLFMGELAIKDKAWNVALPFFQRALEQDPDNLYATKNLAEIWEELSLTVKDAQKNEYEQKALEYYAAAIDLSGGTDVEILLKSALLHFKCGDTDEALQEIDTIEELIYNPDTWKDMDAESRERTKTLLEVIEFLRKRLGNDLNNTDIYYF